MNVSFPSVTILILYFRVYQLTKQAIPIPISFNDLHMSAVYLLAYYICSGNLVDINDL